MNRNIFKKRIKYLLVSVMMFSFCIITAGCHDSKDINEKLIATAVACDLKDDEIIFCIEIADITKKGDEGGGGAKYTLVKAHGKTLPEVRTNLDSQMDKPIFLSGVRALIFTESFASEYLVEYLYRFRSDENYRKKIETVIAMDDLETMFTTLHEKEESVGFLVEGLIQSQEESGQSFSRTTMRLIENVSSRYTGILMPCIALQEKELALTGYSVLDNNKITGFIPIEESKAVIFLKADKPKFSYVVPYNDINLTIQVELKKRKITASYENSEIGFDIKMDFDAELLYGDQKTPYYFEEAATNEVTETLKGMLLKELCDAIEQSLIDYKTDYLQLDDEFRIRYPEAFDNLDWRSEFPKSAVTIHVNVDLSTTYMLDYGAVDVK